ncbi:MAG TPA: NfeD family protein [Candidatus Altiarchaeales archaeon]|nr:NfeD family protein [Candidatus Altiarchaeales archaeon]
MQPEIWVIIAVIFFIGEILTPTFFLLWFGIGSFLAAIVAFFGLGDIAQILVFLITSFILVILSRPLGEMLTKKQAAKTVVDTYIGEKGKVIETIDPDKNTGLVRVKKDIWRADANEIIPEGSDVVVIGVEGTHLIVKKVEGGEEK